MLKCILYTGVYKIKFLLVKISKFSNENLHMYFNSLNLLLNFCFKKLERERENEIIKNSSIVCFKYSS